MDGVDRRDERKRADTPRKHENREEEEEEKE